MKNKQVQIEFESVKINFELDAVTNVMYDGWNYFIQIKTARECPTNAENAAITVPVTPALYDYCAGYLRFKDKSDPIFLKSIKIEGTELRDGQNKD